MMRDAVRMNAMSDSATQNVKFLCHYGVTSEKPYLVWFLSPDSMLDMSRSRSG